MGPNAPAKADVFQPVSLRDAIRARLIYGLGKTIG